MMTFVKYMIIIIPVFLMISGAWLLFLPNLWVNGPDGPHDLIFQVLGTPQLQAGRIYNVSIGHSIVRSDGSKWVPTNEMIAEHWVTVTNVCKITDMVMITAKNGHLVLPKAGGFGAGVQAADPPQFVAIINGEYKPLNWQYCPGGDSLK